MCFSDWGVVKEINTITPWPHIFFSLIRLRVRYGWNQPTSCWRCAVVHLKALFNYPCILQNHQHDGLNRTRSPFNRELPKCISRSLICYTPSYRHARPCLHRPKVCTETIDSDTASVPKPLVSRLLLKWRNLKTRENLCFLTDPHDCGADWAIKTSCQW